MTITKADDITKETFLPMWNPDMSAAPRDTVILVFVPDGVDVDEHVYTWPADIILTVVHAYWHEPNRRTGAEAGWYVNWTWFDGGVWDDPGITFDPIKVEPTHWMPLPPPPSPE